MVNHLRNRTSPLLLCAALIVGLFFVFLYPPWQHYDEPGHFEYAWLIANEPGWPKEGNYNQEMRIEVAASMIERHFFDDSVGWYPDLLSVRQPINIGISQTDDLPLYYFLVSLPLRVFRFSDITFQLYVARFISLLLFLVMVWGGHKAACIIFGEDNPLRWMVPVFMISLPGLLDIMTAVNNDVAAIAFGTLFFGTSASLIKNGFGIKTLLVHLVSITLCLLSKVTVWFVLPLGIFALALAIVPRRKRIFVWLGVVVSIAAVAVALVSWRSHGTPWLYFAQNTASLPTRVKTDSAPVGVYTVALAEKPEAKYNCYQLLTDDGLESLAGQKVTLGGWAWADMPIEIRYPSLSVSYQEISFTDSIELTQTPTFYSFHTTFPENPQNGWLVIQPVQSDAGTRVYLDGWVLTTGEFSPATSPVFENSSAQTGTWDGKPFTNYLRNASFEEGLPRLSRIGRKVEDLINKGSISYPFILLDIDGVHAYLTNSAGRLFRTFWGYFGWAHIPFLGGKPYQVFFGLSAFSLLGILAGLVRRRKMIDWNLLLFFSSAILIELFAVILRGAGSWFLHTQLSVSRYIFPVIIPMAALINWGWYQAALLVPQSLRTRKHRFAIFSFIVPCLIIDIWAIITVHAYYY